MTTVHPIEMCCHEDSWATLGALPPQSLNLSRIINLGRCNTHRPQIRNVFVCNSLIFQEWHSWVYYFWKEKSTFHALRQLINCICCSFKLLSLHFVPRSAIPYTWYTTVASAQLTLYTLSILSLTFLCLCFAFLGLEYVFFFLFFPPPKSLRLASRVESFSMPNVVSRASSSTSWPPKLK